MEWRIRERSDGSYCVERGNEVKSQPNPFGPGNIMPYFMVYELHTCDTKKQALNLVKKQLDMHKEDFCKELITIEGGYR